MDEIKNITPEDSRPSETESLPSESHEPAPSVVHDFQTSSPKRFSLSLPKLNKKAFGISGVVAGVLLLFLIVFGLLPGLSAYGSAQKVIGSGKELYAALQAKDIEKVKSTIQTIKKELGSLNGAVGKLGWTRVLPFAGGYWQDANSAIKGSMAGLEATEIVLVAIEPYADILGFDGGQKATEGMETAEDRIDFIVKTIGGLVPQLDKISEKTAVMAVEFNKINPNRYPTHFKGGKLQANIRQGIRLVNQINDFATNGKPLLSQVPYLLGVEGQRSYLFLFQNDKELRPTGGFITAYSIVKVKDGKFEPTASNDIYNLDRQFNSRIPAPEIIKNYLPLVPYWYLRDMNLSPDFKISMDTFSENYGKIRSLDAIDGIIAVDTYPLVEILKVIGRIGVPGFGNFSAEDDPRCNCPVVIYELESFADVAGPVVWDDISGKIVYKPPHYDNRKEILGPLMNSLIANAMGQPKEKLPDLFDAAWRSITEKHVLFYMKKQEVQKAVESFNIAGTVIDSSGDYLHINDANFAGAKANLYVQEEVTLEVEPAKDGSTNTLTVKYKNPQKHDGWLNGPYRDLVRIYVPKGSTVLDSTGFDEGVKTYEDLGKSVFEGFFILRPEGVLEIRIKYKTQVSKDKEYKLLIQKQPGTEGHKYAVKVGGRTEEFELRTDKEIHF